MPHLHTSQLTQHKHITLCRHFEKVLLLDIHIESSSYNQCHCFHNKKCRYVHVTCNLENHQMYFDKENRRCFKLI